MIHIFMNSRFPAGREETVRKHLRGSTMTTALSSPSTGGSLGFASSPFCFKSGQCGLNSSVSYSFDYHVYVSSTYLRTEYEFQSLHTFVAPCVYICIHGAIVNGCHMFSSSLQVVYWSGFKS